MDRRAGREALDAWQDGDARFRQGVGMVEFRLDGWTVDQRESLAFLLDDAEVEATWGATSVSVPDDAADRVRRFVEFLATPGPSDGVPVITSHAWDEVAPLSLADAPDLPDPDVASTGLRFAGFLVDGFVLCLVIGPAYALGVTWLVGWGLAPLYTILMVGLLGQTLGNMAVRTRVVPVESRQGPPGVRAGLVRWLVPNAPAFVSVVVPWFSWVSFLWLIAVYSPVARGPLHRGLHDRAAGVIVIDERAVARRAGTPRAEDHPAV